jgi:HD-GYP domain-containing protein (c-di-GMP phosphodiesterase class II)
MLAMLDEVGTTGLPEMFDRLAAAMDDHFPHTRGRSRRIATYCSLLAGELDLGESERRDLEIASLVHDIGMLGVPAEVPRKKGRLTPSEFAFIRQHPVIGAHILEALPEMRSVVPIVRHHHERWDGTGYPDALQGRDIPVAAGVIAVAEAVDAITHARPYRATSSLAIAAKLVQQASRSQFIPEVAQAFARVVDRIAETIPEEVPALTSRRVRRQL